MRIRPLALSLAAAALASSSPRPALALTYEVTPSVQQVLVVPGGTYSGTMIVRNTTKKPIDLTSKVMDWTYERPDGAKKFFPSGTTKFSCGKWISYSPAAFRLASGQVQEVRYSLTVPPDAKGGYFSAILFSGITPMPKQHGVTINLALQMGTLFVVEIDKTQKIRGEITKMETLSTHPLVVEAKFKNEGNIRIEAKGRLSVLDSRGSAVGWTQFTPLKTLPGDEFAAQASWAGKLAPGKYKMIGTFELTPDQILIKEKDFEVK